MNPRRWAAFSVVLGLAFAARVAGQAIERWWAVGFLPEQDAWQGSSLPFPALFAAQLVILVIIAVVTIRMHRGGSVLGSRWVAPAFAFGVLYFAVMVVRLVLGLVGDAGLLGQESFAAGRWFTAYLPTVFHLVLATEVMLLARYQQGRRPQIS